MPDYFDRHGKPRRPNADSVIKPRQGAFIVAVFNNRLLLNVEPHAPNVPELPGGGIDAGEAAIQAATREFYEETGMSFIETKATNMHSQFVHFYADDDDEFWDYEQIFFLFADTALAPLYFEERKSNPSGLYCFWQKLDNLDNIPIHYMHRLAINQLI
jgi:8-oxo-dGTP pyrophosphatase MutT (NUDIX family)